MDIGFVHFSTEERKRVIGALQRLREHGTIDELGIGRIRDAFADMMFPGISTLQHHAKYFAVLPHLYYMAQQGSYKSVREVKEKVIDLEIKMTKALMEGSPEGTNGITGSESIRNSSKYVKYDPSYIYWTGLVAFGIIKNTGSLYNLLLDYSKRDKLHKYRSSLVEDEGGMDDLGDEDGCAFFSKPQCNFDINRKINIALSKNEAKFIRYHILSSEKTKTSMLAYFLSHDEISCPKEAGVESFLNFDVSQIDNPVLQNQLRLAQNFSRFIFPIHVRYNYVFADGCENIEATEQLLKIFLDSLRNAEDVYTEKFLNEIFAFLGDCLNDSSVKNFCELVLDYVLQGKESGDFSMLDKLLMDREKSIKGNIRYKLHHPQAYAYDIKHPVHFHYLTYRWGITWTIVNEIREGLKRV